MNKYLKGCIILPFLCVGIFFLTLLLGNIQVKFRRDNLAKTLQVRVDDYPYPQSFPVYYFFSRLKSEMSVDEVHEVMKGYAKVYNCSFRELYYFYSQNDDDSLRLELVYNKKGLFEKMFTEDNNSRHFQVSPDCSDGLFKKEYFLDIP